MSSLESLGPGITQWGWSACSALECFRHYWCRLQLTQWGRGPRWEHLDGSRALVPAQPHFACRFNERLQYLHNTFPWKGRQLYNGLGYLQSTEFSWTLKIHSFFKWMQSGFLVVIVCLFCVLFAFVFARLYAKHLRCCNGRDTSLSWEPCQQAVWHNEDLWWGL